MIKKLISKFRIKRLKEYFFWKLGVYNKETEVFNTKRFNYSNNSIELRKYINTKHNYDGILLDLFVSPDSKNFVNKWHHYLPIYENYFSAYLDKNINFLEIGVADGGSLEMWSKYFSKNSKIYGIDINEECKKYENENIKVFIGDATDSRFLKDNIFTSVNYFDIILDDGSHKMEDIKQSLINLYPKLKVGGLYIIEDLHTSYWPKFNGGINKKDNFFNYIKNIIDDMHFDFHKHGDYKTIVKDSGYGLHIYNSLVIIEKREKLDIKFSNTKFIN